MLLKGTKVDGVYAEDPVKNPKAAFFTTVTFQRALEDHLRVMDATALSLCQENRLPVLVFNMTTPGNVEKVLRGERIGTLIEPDPKVEK